MVGVVDIAPVIEPIGSTSPIVANEAPAVPQVDPVLALEQTMQPDPLPAPIVRAAPIHAGAHHGPTPAHGPIGGQGHAGAHGPNAMRPHGNGVPQPRPMAPAVDGEDGPIERTATAPQLRRFIKSRAYVPMHELRRRFLINGGDDEVTPVDLERTRIFVGLPEREGRLLGELLRGGDIGYELSLDPITPIVVGVYPMRPVTRG